MGSNVVTINLDDHCAVDYYTTLGIFVNIGDIIIVTGSANAASGQEWQEPQCQCLDECIVRIMDVGNFCYDSFPEKKLKVITMEALKTGHTSFDIHLSWGGEIVRQEKFDIYVD